MTVEDFEARVDAFFREHAKPAAARGCGVGDDSLVSAGLTRNEPGPSEIEEARTFQRLLFDNGLAWLMGPKEYGGAELAT